MALVAYEPWSLMNRFHSQLDQLFDTSAGVANDAATHGWTPAVDINEEAERFVLTADLPGVDPEAIDVTMEGNQLTIRGERDTTVTSPGDGYQRIERARGEFFRRFTLPESADATAIAARGNNGVLEISIAKKQATKARRIAVKK